MIWFIIIPCVFAQYILAIFTLTRLAYCKFSTGKYAAWNLFILLGFFIGSIVFLALFYTHKDKWLKDELQPADRIINDEKSFAGEENDQTSAVNIAATGEENDQAAEKNADKTGGEK